MPLIFENGIKFIFLLLLTGVYSRQYYSQLQDQSDRYQRDDDASDWDQYYHNQVQIQQDPDQTERHSHHSHWNRHQHHQNRVDRSQNKIYSDQGKVLSRLLNSKKNPILVFLSQNEDKRDFSVLNAANNLILNSSPEESRELFNPASADENKVYYPASPAENDAYVLYNVLRTTQADEDLDPEANEQFERTKELLRSAFALRCGQKSACERKCPEKKPECPMNCQKVEKVVKNECKQTCPDRPRQCEKKCKKVVEKKVDECEKKVDECEEEQEQECESKCQKVFDELDACPKPKKSCGPKCGKTMPPSWLLRFLRS